jgi:hypothetical protein
MRRAGIGPCEVVRGGVVAVHGPDRAGRRRAGTRPSGRARQRARRACRPVRWSANVKGLPAAAPLDPGRLRIGGCGGERRPEGAVHHRSRARLARAGVARCSGAGADGRCNRRRRSDRRLALLPHARKRKRVERSARRLIVVRSRLVTFGDGDARSRAKASAGPEPSRAHCGFTLLRVLHEHLLPRMSRAAPDRARRPSIAGTPSACSVQRAACSVQRAAIAQTSRGAHRGRAVGSRECARRLR